MKRKKTMYAMSKGHVRFVPSTLSNSFSVFYLISSQMRKVQCIMSTRVSHVYGCACLDRNLRAKRISSICGSGKKATEEQREVNVEE